MVAQTKLKIKMRYVFLGKVIRWWIQVREHAVEGVAQTLGALLGRLHNRRLEVNRQAEAEHGLDENSQRFYVNPGGEALAEVNLKPSD